MKVKGLLDKKVNKNNPNLGGIHAVGFELLESVKNAKDDFIEKIDSRLEEIESAQAKIEKNINNTFNEKITQFDELVEDITDRALNTLEEIHKLPNIKGIDGTEGKPGKDADEDKMIERLSKLIPSEKNIVKKVIAKIPDSKASLKVIRETLEVKPEQLAKDLENLPVEDFQLSTGNIKGLEKKLDNLGRSGGYLHGGGFNNIYDATTQVATGLTGLKFSGSGVDSVTKDNSTGIVTVSISGGGGTSSRVYNEVPVGDVDGINTIFTTNTDYTSNTTALFLNGLRQKLVGGVDYTESSSDTVTFVIPPVPGDFIVIDYDSASAPVESFLLLQDDTNLLLQDDTELLLQ